MIGRFSVAPSLDDHEVQRVNAAINEEQANVLDNNNKKGEMAGGVESLVSAQVSNSKVQASVPIPDARVEKEDTSGSLNEKQALELENSVVHMIIECRRIKMR